jgi:hypothetical protein
MGITTEKTTDLAQDVDPARTGTFGATLLATMISAPVAALLLSVLACLAYPGVTSANLDDSLLATTGWLPLFMALGVTLVGWLALAAIFRQASSVTQASPSSYLGARERLRDLARQLDVNDDLTVRDLSDIQDGRLEALKRRNDAVRILRRPGAQWVTGAGYDELWEALYRADESLILCAKNEDVISWALSDIARLEGSAIPNRDALLSRLERGVVLFSPAALALLDKAPTNAHALMQDENVGRREIQAVRKDLNDFVAWRFTGIITARNLLTRATVCMGVFVYLLFIVALLAGAPTRAIIAVTALYLTGAVIGVFSWLLTARSTETAIEDYGLSTVRLLATPTLAGMAALFGVFLAHIVGAPLVHSTIVNDLESLFALTLDNVLLAFIFGFAPGLVVLTLQAQTDRYTSEIKSTLATQQSKP